jgi:hypothetical protein
MAANTSQIFSRVADVQWVALPASTANTTMDGTGGTLYAVFTADATNGGRIERVNVMHLGTNVAGMVRFWVNNGSTVGTAANNTLIEELAMPANTVSQTAIAVPQVLIRVPIILPPGYKLYATPSTSVASGYQVTAFGGKY